MFFTPEELSELRGSLLFEELRTYRENVISAFNAVRRAVLSKFPEVFPPAVFTLENYRFVRGALGGLTPPPPRGA